MSTEYSITGNLVVLNDTKIFPSGFCKREFVVETMDDKYPQKIKLEAVKEGCDKLDAYQVGDEITVSFNIRGNEHNGKYYVSLSAWKFDRHIGESRQAPKPPPQQPAQKPPLTATADVLDEEDDIPF